MPFQLFHKINPTVIDEISNELDLLGDIINSNQKKIWLDLFCGEVPEEILRWNGSLQEIYFLLNEIRLNTLNHSSLVRIQTKNRGLDWVKINKMVKTRYGKIYKESRPQTTEEIDTRIIRFISKLKCID